MKKIRILIADDNEENLYFLRTLLQGNGCEVTEARHGTDALDAARRNPPDLIITDILMPVMDGFALCREWKKDRRLKTIPFIFYTATYTDDRDRAFALSLGADQFVIKPAEPDAFMTVVRETLQQAANPAAGASALPPGKPSGAAETVYLKQYNEALIRKLEAKMEQLEKANRALEQDIADRKRVEEEKEKLQARLNQAQKMEAIGRLAGGVAHDFNNMLSVILGYTEIALKATGPAQPLFTYLQEIRKVAEHSADLTRQLLAFARQQTITPRVMDLNGIIEGMLNMLRRLIGEGVTLTWIPGKELWRVKVDPAQVDQILANLCVNSRDATGGIGTLSIETANVSFDEDYCAVRAGFVPGEYVQLAASDNGCGMDKATQDRIFEPFFTTKNFGEGTGLGLATVYGIVRQNGGFINVYSEPGMGTTFKVYFPRCRDEASPVDSSVSAEPAVTGDETVLLVEDESALLELNKMMLEGLGYRVLTAGTPGEALRLAGENSGKIQLLLTDVIMPEMNGRELARQILAYCPDIRCLFTSGYTANVIAHHGIVDEDIHFIQKPFSTKELARKLREVLRGRRGI